MLLLDATLMVKVVGWQVLVYEYSTGRAWLFALYEEGLDLPRCEFVIGESELALVDLLPWTDMGMAGIRPV